MISREQLQQIRSALVLAFNTSYSEHNSEIFAQSIAILDAELAAPEQEPFCYVNVNAQGDVTRTIKREDKWCKTPLYRHPAPQSAQPMQWIDVSERVPDEAQIVLFVLRGKVVVGAWIAGIFWYDNAKQVATAWMPLPPPPEFGVGGYPVTAPVAAPQREWQSLTKDEINDCAGAEIYPSTWAMAFARAIEAVLKEKNHG